MIECSSSAPVFPPLPPRGHFSRTGSATHIVPSDHRRSAAGRETKRRRNNNTSYSSDTCSPSHQRRTESGRDLKQKGSCVTDRTTQQVEGHVSPFCFYWEQMETSVLPNTLTYLLIWGLAVNIHTSTGSRRGKYGFLHPTDPVALKQGEKIKRSG